MERCVWIRCGFFVGLAVFAVVVQAGEATASFDFDGVGARDAYEAVATRFDVEVAVDKRLKDGPVNLALDDVGAEEALETIARSLGHFVVEMGEERFLVADDTPQNRREHERLAVQVFALEYLPAKEADRLLRSLIDARRVNVDERLNTVTVRDTVSKVCLAGRLLEIADQPEPEVELALTVLEVEAEAIAPDAVMPASLSAEAVHRLVEAGDVLWSGGLSLVGAGASQVAARVDDAGFTLDIRARAHSGSDATTLDMELNGDVVIAHPEGEVEHRKGSIRSSMRVHRGEAAIVRLPDSGAGPWRVLVILPTEIRPSRFSEEQLTALRVGTETRIDFTCER